LKPNKHTGSLTLSGIRLNPRIGVTPEERSEPQECRADLTVWCSFEAAAASDSLDESVDYSLILQRVQDLAREREFHLLETLASSIIEDCLKNFPVIRVGIRLRKRPEVLINNLDFVEIEMEKVRKD
jgi:7,8-dihydroneopterin aldolase/epimerase/oxygenase